MAKVLVDRKLVECDVPLWLVPGIFYSDKPTAEEALAAEYAALPIRAFARSSSDMPDSSWEEDYAKRTGAVTR